MTLWGSRNKFGMTNSFMCGRYAFTPDEKFYDRFEVENRLDSLEARYNVAPGQEMPVVTRNSPNKALIMRWGLIPYWSKDAKIGYRTINARAETVRTKPAFRKPFLTQRCLIPASGFYEWEKRPKGKIPYYFYLKTGELFSFAGLYDTWHDEAGKDVQSYAIITSNANGLVGKIHERMPVILTKDAEQLWLDKQADPEALFNVLRPYTSELMEAYPVSSEVNSAKNDTPGLVKPANPLLKL